MKWICCMPFVNFQNTEMAVFDNFVQFFHGFLWWEFANLLEISIYNGYTYEVWKDGNIPWGPTIIIIACRLTDSNLNT
jgi:hypothetical protein